MRSLSWVLLALLGVQVCLAKAAEKQDVMVGRGPDGRAWQLLANQAAMADVLDELQRATGIKIHYSVLPKAPVSATCVADKVQALLGCLLGQTTGLVFNNANAALPKEVWILGSSAAYSTSGCAPGVPFDNHASFKEQADTAQLYADANSSDPKRRGDALYSLAMADDDRVDNSLRSGLDDDSPLVRGQALGAWVRRYGAEEAGSELQRAFQDADASVRMRAVELSADSSLLAQALQDSDATVRMLAKARLDEQVN